MKLVGLRKLGNYSVHLWVRMLSWFRNSPVKEIKLDDRDDGMVLDLGDDTIKYLGDLASDSFKRQIELDESVWRSLPFFAATFAFVATIIGKSATDVPHWNKSTSGKIAFVMLFLAVCSLAWSLRWFWVVLRPREYEYPAPDDRVKEYASGIRQFYIESGVSDSKTLDGKTLAELRLFMIDQYGNASTTNLGHNAAKLKARPKVLLFMLLGFALAFACEAIIFVNTHVGAQPVEQGVATDGTATKPDAIATTGGRQSVSAPPAGSSEIAVGEGRRQLLGRKLQAGDQEQAVSRPRTPVPPPTSSGSSPQRPTRPLPQVIAKDQALNEGTNRPAPTPPARKD